MIAQLKVLGCLDVPQRPPDCIVLLESTYTRLCEYIRRQDERRDQIAGKPPNTIPQLNFSLAGIPYYIPYYVASNKNEFIRIVRRERIRKNRLPAVCTEDLKTLGLDW